MFSHPTLANLGEPIRFVVDVMGLRAVVHWLPFDPHLRLLAEGPAAEIFNLISRARALEVLSAAGASRKVLSYVPDGEPRSSWTPVS